MKISVFTSRVLLVLVFICSCSKVPYTNRKQVSLIPESELVSLSLTEYKSFLSKNPPVAVGNPDANMVKRVGSKIQAAVVKFLTQKKLSDRIQGYKWEFNLVDDKTVNAWCMPGGKVVVYSGLLAVTQNETALAIVMGHEIAHAVARHGNERMSQQMVTQLGGTALSVALQNKSAETQAIFNTAYGVGSTVGLILPYSRLHESEADKLGLVFAAMAGYDPREAPKFWKRMAQSGGSKPPEILSTHPSDEKRVADLNKFMPEALKYYKPNS
ncbi:M48 family metallopeptidase [soil metagenome]